MHCVLVIHREGTVLNTKVCQRKYDRAICDDLRLARPTENILLPCSLPQGGASLNSEVSSLIHIR